MEVDLSDLRSPGEGQETQDVEAVLDYIEHARELEERVREMVGPSWADQVQQLVRDPVVREIGQKVWYGTEGADPEVGPPPPQEAGEVSPEATEEVTGGVTEGDMELHLPEGGIRMFDHPALPDLPPYPDITNFTIVRDDGVTEDVTRWGYGVTREGSLHIVAAGETVLRTEDAIEFLGGIERTAETVMEKWRATLGNTTRGRIEELLRRRERGDKGSDINMKEMAGVLGTSHAYVRKISAQRGKEEVSAE